MIRLPKRASMRGAILLALIFAISRIIFYAIGIHFNATTLGVFWQFLDPDLLRTRLVESVWNLHSQPPLYNLFLGIVLKLAPVHYAAVIHGIYIVFGFGIVVVLFQLLCDFGISPKWAFRIAALFAISPATVVFENWLFYDYPLALLFLLSVLFLFRFVRDSKPIDGFAFFSTIAMIVLTRSLFHWIWVVGIVGMMLISMKDRRKMVLQAAAVPLLIIALFYTKNYVQFGSLSGSTWFGQHLSRVTTAEIPDADKARLVSEGKLSHLALIPAFTELDAYPANLWQNVHTGIPALDQVRKPNGWPNYNHLAYIGLSKQYQQDAEYVVAHYPLVALVSVGKSAFFYLRAPNEFYMLRSQNIKMDAYETFFRRFFYGEMRDYPEHATKAYDANFEEHVLDSTPFLMMILIPCTVVFGGLSLLRTLRNPNRSAKDIAVAYIAINLLFVSIIANIFEMGENNRIRFMMDPLFILMGALMLQKAYAYARVLSAKRPRVVAIVHRIRSIEPNLARQFRLFL